MCVFLVNHQLQLLPCFYNKLTSFNENKGILQQIMIGLYRYSEIRNVIGFLNDIYNHQVSLYTYLV